MEYENAMVAKKKYLSRYLDNKKYIDRLIEKVETLDARITAVKSPSYSDMPKGGKRVTVEDLIAEKADLEKRIKELTKRGEVLRRETLAEIDRLYDPRYVEVLESKYVYGESIMDICETTYYSSRTVSHLLREAIQALITL